MCAHTAVLIQLPDPPLLFLNLIPRCQQPGRCRQLPSTAVLQRRSSGKFRGPSQEAWGNLLFLLPLNEVPFATGAVKILIALIFFFSFKLSFVEKLRDVRT